MDKSKLIGVISKDAKPEKLPTLLQYIKRNRKPKSHPLHRVELIWVPGKFDNYTLQTNVYRVIINSKHPLYTVFGEFFEGNDCAETPVGIRITNWDEGEYRFEEPKTSGLWQVIGNSGYRWVND